MFHRLVPCRVTLLYVLGLGLALATGATAAPGGNGNGKPGGDGDPRGEGSKPQPAQMLVPRPGFVATSSSVHFEWSPGNGVSEYVLRIGTTAQAENVFAQQLGTATSITVDETNTADPYVGLPVRDVAALYVRLSSLIKKKWTHQDYIYLTTPPPISQIVDWRKCYPTDAVFLASSDCPQYPQGWSVDDVIGLMQAYPQYFFHTGIFENRHPGAPIWVAMGGHVDSLQARALEAGVDLSRIVITYRPDVFRKYSPGHYDCAPQCGWEGIMDGSKGEPPFDTSWVLRVPSSLHDRVVDDFWAGEDPFEDPIDGTGNNWASNLDRAEIESLNTSEQKVALYGSSVITDGETLSGRFAVTAVAMDLRVAEYRTWSTRYLLYKLDDYGVAPGEPFSLALTYKPGWHTHYEGPAPDDVCFVSELSDGTPVHMWTGPAHVCSGTAAPGGLFHPTQYGPGEYEQAVSLWILELIDTLESAGYQDFKLYTEEAPDYKDFKWSILSNEVRDSPRLIGDRRISITPDAANP